MQVSYSKNYIKIYFYQILSIVLGFGSLFVVVPYLSADKVTYGIYSVCISVTVFLSYADLGFLGAGMKYAAESFALEDRESEMRFIGFSQFILLIFLLLFSGTFLFLSFNPEVLINEIEPGKQTYIARNLLLILAIASPTIIVQRMLQVIFGIRLQEYIMQRINSVGNVVKIFSVFYFFGSERYNIISYYVFIQIVNVFCVGFGVLQARKKYSYDFVQLLRQIKFNYQIFNKTKALAFSGLVMTVSWVVYYELDSIAIAKLIGAQEVAIYAIGFTILTFCRSLLGVFFSPFSARFNHFIGLNQMEELKVFYRHILTITLPVVVFPIVAIVFFAKPIVISWVGVEYEQSVDIVRWLVLCNILAFVSYPTGMLMVALEKLKTMYAFAGLMPFVYWVGIAFTLKTLGLESFAVFKFFAFTISGILYLRISFNFLNISFVQFLKKNIIPYVPGLIIMSLIMIFTNELFIDGKNKLNLVINAFIIGMGILVAMGISVVAVQPLRVYLKNVFNIIIKR